MNVGSWVFNSLFDLGQGFPLTGLQFHYLCDAL